MYFSQRIPPPRKSSYFFFLLANLLFPWDDQLLSQIASHYFGLFSSSRELKERLPQGHKGTTFLSPGYHCPALPWPHADVFSYFRKNKQTLWRLMLNGRWRQTNRMLRAIQLSWSWPLLLAGLPPGARLLHPATAAFLPKKQATPNQEERKNTPESFLSQSLHVPGFLIFNPTFPSTKHLPEDANTFLG